MKKLKKIFALGLVLTMVLVLGACDKNISGLEDVKEKGELVFAVAKQNEPFHFKDEEEFAVAVVKSDQKFVDALDEVLEEMIEDRTYAKLTEKWFDEDLTARLK